ncbi:HEAT repeat domain-containing protein [Stieleria varia]|uniref:HEAT repeat protein n=1 Tax=Stieleria varia TaxID=2528005 RepID=A0A5C6B2Y2_9BACT|nr:HEAT repeat domain-containing protein [Stieleria varia]TWU05891.1 hypothetical protein Pla52n_16060 [Stieleria varia]
MTCRSFLLIAGFLLVGVAAAPTVPADTIDLVGGGQISGRILEKKGSNDTGTVIIAINDQMKLAVPMAKVSKLLLDSEFAGYSKAAAAAGDDPEKHYELARLCATQELTAHRNYHMQRAIELDPDHSKARSALGYVQSGKGWILFEEQQRNRGLINSGGWKLPEAIALEEAKDEAALTAKRWHREVASLRKAALSNNKNAAESLAALQAIEDPLAAEAIADELAKSAGGKQPKAMRLLWVQKLGQFRNGPAVQALTLAGVNDADPDVRDEALNQLTQFGWRSAAGLYVQMLDPKKSSNRDVKNALAALLRAPDPELWRVYADALVTTHETEIPAGAGTNAGFSQNGNGSFSTGSKKVVIKEDFKNPDALLLLREIAPGADFGYNKQAWLDYFAEQLTSYNGGLNRDL